MKKYLLLFCTLLFSLNIYAQGDIGRLDSLAGALLPDDEIAIKRGSGHSSRTYKGKLGKLFSLFTGKQELFQTTIAGLRAMMDPSVNIIYYVKDRGKEGEWYYDPFDNTSVDDLGLCVVSINGKVFKRIFTKINPCWFGAIPNDALDDYAAIQTTIEKAPAHAVIEFSPGEYLVSNTPKVRRNNISFFGYRQATIKRMANTMANGANTDLGEGMVFSVGNITDVTRRSNVVIDGIIFDGNIQNQPSGLDKTIGGYGIFLRSVDDVHIKGCVIKNTAGTSIYGRSVSGIYFHNNDIYSFGILIPDFGKNGIDVMGTLAENNYGINSKNMISNNRIFEGFDSGIGFSATTNLIVESNSISKCNYAGIEGVPENKTTLLNTARNVIIDGNHVTDNKSGIIIQTQAEQNVSMTGNNVKNCKNKAFEFEQLVGGTLTMTGNTFENWKTEDNSATTHGFIFNADGDFNIKGNTFRMDTNTVSVGGQFIAVLRARSFLFSGNTLKKIDKGFAIILNTLINRNTDVIKITNNIIESSATNILDIGKPNNGYVISQIVIKDNDFFTQRTSGTSLPIRFNNPGLIQQANIVGNTITDNKAVKSFGNTIQVTAIGNIGTMNLVDNTFADCRFVALEIIGTVARLHRPRNFALNGFRYYGTLAQRPTPRPEEIGLKYWCTSDLSEYIWDGTAWFRGSSLALNPGGPNKAIQYVFNNAFAGDTAFVFNPVNRNVGVMQPAPLAPLHISPERSSTSGSKTVIIDPITTFNSNGDTATALFVNPTFLINGKTATRSFLQFWKSANKTKAYLTERGTLTLRIENEIAEERGTVEVTTPDNQPGIVIRNAAGKGRSQMKQIEAGGIALGADTGSTSPRNQWTLFPNGNMALQNNTPSATDNGWRLQVTGGGYFQDSLRVVGLSGSGQGIGLLLSNGRFFRSPTLPISLGGTEASTAAQARINLGLQIGVDVQPYSPKLTSIAGLTCPTGQSIRSTSGGGYECYTPPVPGLPENAIQFGKSGVFTGDADFVYDTKKVGIYQPAPQYPLHMTPLRSTLANRHGKMFVLDGTFSYTANGDTATGLEINPIFNLNSRTSTISYLQVWKNAGVVRNYINSRGVQQLRIQSTNGTEVGSVTIGNPQERPGIDFRDADNNGRSQIKQRSGGGLIFSSNSGTSAPNDHFTLFPNGNAVYQTNSSSASDNGWGVQIMKSLYVNDSLRVAALGGTGNGIAMLTSAGRLFRGSFLPIEQGGTGATNAGQARANLGLQIGSDVQAYSQHLTSIAALTCPIGQSIRSTTGGFYECFTPPVPGLPENAIQFGKSGVFTGDADFVYDNKKVGIFQPAPQYPLHMTPLRSTLANKHGKMLVLDGTFSYTANGDTATALEVNPIFTLNSRTSTISYLQVWKNAGVVRNFINSRGVQQLRIQSTNGAEVGSVTIGNPQERPGIDFRDADNNGRSQIKQRSGGGLVFSSNSGTSAPNDHFTLFPNGNAVYQTNSSSASDNGWGVQIMKSLYVNDSLRVAALGGSGVGIPLLNAAGKFYRGSVLEVGMIPALPYIPTSDKKTTGTLGTSNSLPTENIIKAYVDALIAGTSTGTVTSVSVGALAPLFTTTTSNNATTPSTTFIPIPKSAAHFYAGPISGSDANPDFRILVPSDIPELPYIPTSDKKTTGTLGTSNSLVTEKIIKEAIDAAVLGGGGSPETDPYSIHLTGDVYWTGNKGVGQNGANATSTATEASSYELRFKSSNWAYQSSTVEPHVWTLQSREDQGFGSTKFALAMDGTDIITADASGIAIKSGTGNLSADRVVANTISGKGAGAGLALNSGGANGTTLLLDETASGGSYFRMKAAPPGGHVELMATNASETGYVGINIQTQGQAPVTFNNIIETKGIAVAVRKVTASTTVTVTDYQILVDATAGPVTITLGDAHHTEGRVLKIKKIDASANAVTIATVGGETIDGSLTNVISTQNTNRSIVADGVNTWYINN